MKSITMMNMEAYLRAVHAVHGPSGMLDLIASEIRTEGTVVDAPEFNPETDCEILKKSMDGIITNEKSITSILAFRSNNQRQVIRRHFATMYGKNLMKKLKRELRGNFERTVLGLLMPQAEYDAYQCHDAISGIRTDEKCLIEILCSRSNADIHALRDAYVLMYNRDLEQDLSDSTSGHFKKFLISLVQGQRHENEAVDYQIAAQDAFSLYEATKSRFGTNKSVFNVILATRSFPQLRIIFDLYEKLSKHTLEKEVRRKMTGGLKEGMLAIIKCAGNRPMYFAERLYLSMKGLGTDNKTLVRILISRSEIDMVQIKEEFKNRYTETLESFIHDDTSGEYRKILLKLCAGS